MYCLPLDRPLRLAPGCRRPRARRLPTHPRSGLTSWRHPPPRRLYQYVAATLRGLRAYHASAALETTSAFLLLIFSCIAAHLGTALGLLLAYALALLFPLLFYFILLLRFFRQLPPQTALPIPKRPSPPITSSNTKTAPTSNDLHLRRFARWTLIRLLCVMTFGFLSIWAVGFLSPTFFTESFDNYATPQEQTANFAMPYRIAQLLAYFAVTFWASSYGIAATAWSHHQIRRAKVQLFRVGKFGVVVMSLAALFLLLSRPLFAAILPSAYSTSILQFLPPMLALFFWYGLLAFCSVYTDLQEKPHLGALLWAAAILIQLTLILIPMPDLDPKDHVLLASAIALAVSLFLLAPLLLWHPLQTLRHRRPTGPPLPRRHLTLFPSIPGRFRRPRRHPRRLSSSSTSPDLLIRPPDRRAFRRWAHLAP